MTSAPIPQSTAAPMLTEIVLPGVVEASGLLVQHRPIPAPGRGQAVVEVLATGVSFADQAMRHGRYPGQPKFPFVLGYDFVGKVSAVGPGVDRKLIGRRVAAVTKTGAWTTHALVEARQLVPVPDRLDAAEVETVVVNGITAWQMLHRKARVKSGQTILVHGAGGGVGTTLVQLAHHAGVRVIGTAASRYREALRALGAEPIDYHDPDLAGSVRRLAPHGVDAVFDHLGGSSFRRSFDLLTPSGTLVAYGTGTSAQLGDTDNQVVAFLAMYGRLAAWSLSSKRRALFYNFWARKHIRPRRFHRQLAADLTEVIARVADGAITVQIAARYPLDKAADAMALAESRTVSGKIVLDVTA